MIRAFRKGGAAIGAALLAVVVTGGPARADAVRDSQWYFGPMKLAQAQEVGKDGEGVIVAVIDTGVDTAHQDLRGATVPGQDMLRKANDNDSDIGPHGTGIATLIGGRGHGGGDGLIGVAPRSKIMPITPVNDPTFLADGIRWAVGHGAKVINMSFQLRSGDVVQRAISDALAADVVVVASAGNDHAAVVDEPGSLSGVLAVGSVDRKNKVASFSNYGKDLDLVAYGTVMTVARPNNKYELVHGTSDSAALVSGAAALIRARYPDMPAAEVVDRLTRTATDRGVKGRDDYYGYGQLNVLAALTAPRTPPSATASTATAQAAPPGDAPAASTPVADRSGIPAFLIVAVGVLLLVVALAALMIVRARRSP